LKDKSGTSYFVPVQLTFGGRKRFSLNVYAHPTHMTDPTSPNPAPSVPVAKTQHAHALQDQRLANKIGHAERVIQTVLGKPDLILALAPIGYNELELNRGLALFTAAQTTFSARQQALAVATSTKATRDLTLAVAKEEFTSFRETVQANYVKADRTNLGASGVVPVDMEKFRTNARSAYAAALKYPYLGVLATNGFTLERIDTAIKALDELAATDSACESAHAEAKTATETRDAAGKALAQWMAKFRKLSRNALKKRPDLHALIPE